MKHLSKVSCGGQAYYLLTEVEQDDSEAPELEAFNLVLSDGQTAWSGSVTAEDLDLLCKKVRMDYDDLVSQTQKALTQVDMGSMMFQYDFKKSANKVEFSWKKHIKGEDIKFQLGTTSLREKPDTSEVTRAIFEHAISCTGELQDNIKSLKADNERLIYERAGALKRLDKYVSAKEDIEEELYSKFVVVLNDKKVKLKSLRDRGESAEPSVSRPARSGRLPSSADEEEPESEPEPEDRTADVKMEYDSDFNTDDEEKEPVVPPRKKTKVKAADEDSSLLLDDGGDNDEPLTVRRRRQRGNTAKKTPSKPVIPRVPSSEKKGQPGTSKSSSRRGAIKKSASDQSGDSILADDLMDQI